MMQRLMSLDRLSDRKNRKRVAIGLLLLVLLVSAMRLGSSVMLAAAIAEESSLEPPYELVIGTVVDNAFDDLITQMRRQPALFRIFAPAKKVAGAPENKDAAGAEGVVVLVDRTVGSKGLRSVAVELLDPLLVQIARGKFPDAHVVDGTRPPPPGAPSVSSVQYILGGSLSSLDPLVRTSNGTFRFDLSLIDTKTDYIVAQVSVRFTAKGVNLEPQFCCVSH